MFLKLAVVGEDEEILIFVSYMAVSYYYIGLQLECIVAIAANYS